MNEKPKSVGGSREFWLGALIGVITVPVFVVAQFYNVILAEILDGSPRAACGPLRSWPSNSGTYAIVAAVVCFVLPVVFLLMRRRFVRSGGVTAGILLCAVLIFPLAFFYLFAKEMGCG